MSDNPKLTAEAAERLEADVVRLEGAGRREIAERIGIAREWGDLKENAEYHAAKEEAAMLEGKIARMRDQLRTADIVEEVHAGDSAGMSSTVTFADKASGKDVARPELDALLRFARDGDTVVVHSMDRLARNLDDLRRLVRQLTGRGSPTVSFVDTTYLCTNPCNVFHASSASVSPQLSRRVVKKYAMRFRTLVCCFVFCRAA